MGMKGGNVGVGVGSVGVATCGVAVTNRNDVGDGV